VNDAQAPAVAIEKDARAVRPSGHYRIPSIWIGYEQTAGSVERPNPTGGHDLQNLRFGWYQPVGTAADARMAALVRRMKVKTKGTRHASNANWQTPISLVPITEMIMLAGLRSRDCAHIPGIARGLGFAAEWNPHVG
jgi:hypothetical protein